VQGVKFTLDGRPRSPYTLPIINEELKMLNDDVMYDDVDDYDPTDDANSVAEAGDAEWGYDDGQPDEAQEWHDFDPDC
jgi:hypothetical protein